MLASRSSKSLAFPLTVLACVAAPIAERVAAQVPRVPVARSSFARPVERLVVSGAQALQPFVDSAIADYRRRAHATTFVMAPSDTATGIEQTARGEAQIGMLARRFDDADRRRHPQLVVTRVAEDGIAVVVHASNPIRALTRTQLADVLSGRVRAWADLGGGNGLVATIATDPRHGAFDAVLEPLELAHDADGARANVRIVDGERALLAAVMTDPLAIGFASSSVVQTILMRGGAVRIVPVDGVTPTAATVEGGTYPFRRSLSVVRRPDAPRSVTAFVEFLASEEGRRLLRAADLVPAAPR